MLFFDNSSLFYSPGFWDQLEAARSPQLKAGISRAGGREACCLLQTDGLSLSDLFRGGFLRLPGAEVPCPCHALAAVQAGASGCV